MKLSLIVAVANNHVIGHENKLIWHLPSDLKHFKRLTMGHTLIMGRKTYESIGSPLKGRTTIVLSKQRDYIVAAGCKLAASLSEAIEMVRNEKEVFVAGGEEIYRQAIELKQTHRIYLTRIFADFQGDAFFPDIDTDKWELVERADYDADEQNRYSYSFQIYKRRNTCR